MFFQTTLSRQIGEKCVVDPTTEEEMCASATVVMSVTPKGRITSTVKTGYGSLQAATLLKTLEVRSELFVSRYLPPLFSSFSFFKNDTLYYSADGHECGNKIKSSDYGCLENRGGDWTKKTSLWIS